MNNEFTDSAANQNVFEFRTHCIKYRYMTNYCYKIKHADC